MSGEHVWPFLTIARVKTQRFGVAAKRLFPIVALKNTGLSAQPPDAIVFVFAKITSRSNFHAYTW